jgi:hypothetical protein
LRIAAAALTSAAAFCSSAARGAVVTIGGSPIGDRPDSR